MVIERVDATLVHGTGDERIASPGCSDRTIRCRVHVWATAGLMPRSFRLVRTQDDRLIGFDLRHVCVDGCTMKAPRNGDKAGCSPVDRGTQDRKRSLVTDAAGIPVYLMTGGANCPDSHLPRATLSGLGNVASLPAALPVHLDRG